MHNMFMARTVRERLKELNIDDLFGIKPEIKLLSRLVEAPEAIMAVASGVYDGKRRMFAVTDTVMLVLHTNVVTGGGYLTVPVDKVAVESWKKGILFGNVVLNADGKTWVIKNVHKRTILPFVKALGAGTV